MIFSVLALLLHLPHLQCLVLVLQEVVELVLLQQDSLHLALAYLQVGLLLKHQVQEEVLYLPVPVVEPLVDLVDPYIQTNQLSNICQVLKNKPE
jgi:hypothetical protein